MLNCLSHMSSWLRSMQVRETLALSPAINHLKLLRIRIIIEIVPLLRQGITQLLHLVVVVVVDGSCKLALRISHLVKTVPSHRIWFLWFLVLNHLLLHILRLLQTLRIARRCHRLRHPSYLLSSPSVHRCHSLIARHHHRIIFILPTLLFRRHHILNRFALGVGGEAVFEGPFALYGIIGGVLLRVNALVHVHDFAIRLELILIWLVAWQI